MSGLCLVASVYTACMAVIRPHHLSAGRAAVLAVISALFFTAAVGLQFERLFTIDVRTGSVTRSLSFWGLSLWKSQWPLTAFTGVDVYRMKAGTRHSPMDLVYVGLRTIGGATLAIRYFKTGRDQPSAPANAFANELQRVVGGTALA
jgi:hypothetical protein